MRLPRIIAYLTLLLLLAAPAKAQTEEAVETVETASADTVRTEPAKSTPVPRKVTPVDVDDEKPREVMHYYDKHGEPLKEPVRFLATLDTVTKPKAKPVYPLYNGVTVGLNFGDALFLAFGQRFASFDLHADVSLHNWFFPTLEMGLGFADSTPGKMNFTYKVNPAFYAKIGANYNFVYKSDPAYQVFAGLRLGFSTFKWDVTDVTVESDYWGEQTTFNMPSQRSTALWGEVVAGLKVKIVGNFSLGWTLRWHQKFHVSKGEAGSPWFIPGYGTQNFGFTISAMWTIPAKAKPTPEEIEEAAEGADLPEALPEREN